MNLREYATYDATGLAELVHSNDVLPHELQDLARAGAVLVDPTLNAVTEWFDDPRSTDHPQAPFAGVPFLIKDLSSCTEAGRRCESGSRLFAGQVAPSDNELMRRFRGAGLVTLGRTATSEFAAAAAVETALTGTTRNPWDTARSTAGSSGGAAAAVASGVVPMAHGSDGGGSIRMPAACCGLVGLKPTRGRVSASPAMVYPGDLSVDFALTRSVRDAAALLDALHGEATGDQYVIPPPSRPYTTELTAEAGNLTVGVVTTHLWGGEIDAEVRTAVDRAAPLCEALGAHVVEVSLNFDHQAFIAATVDVWCALIAASVQDAAAEEGLETALGKLEGHTRSWAEYGLGLNVRDLLAGTQVLTDVSRAVIEQTVGVDVLLSSTLPTLPIPLGEYDPNRAVSVDWYYSSAVGNLESTTNVFNATGQPAISLPLYESASGLPIGIHLAGRFGDEATLIRLSAALEAAEPWRHRLPKVHVSVPTQPSLEG